MGAAETRRAIAAAEIAMKPWAARTAGDRARTLRRWFDLMMQEQDALGRLLTREQGKSLSEAKGEIAYAASFIEWFAEEGKRTYGEVLPTHDASKRLITLRQPVGVVGAITPVELPRRHDHPQGRPGPGRRLHHGAEAGQPDAADGAGAGGPGRGGGPAQGAVQRRDRLGGGRSAAS